jgi:hypothetical protein
MSRMKTSIRALLALAVWAACLAAAPVPAPIANGTYQAAPTSLDNGHGFDFELGTWRTHYRILKRPLTGDHTWKDCYGTSNVMPYWGDGGNLEDGDLKCPDRYIGGMTLRTYDARTRQWTLWWGTRAAGITSPPQIGHFEADGTGDFYSNDVWNGKPVVVRYHWSHPQGNPRFEQAFSPDRGRTWEVNWTTDYVRAAPSTPGVWNAIDRGNDGHAGFAYLLGAWKVHAKARSGAEWMSCDGTSTVRAFWGGAGNLEDDALHCGTRDESNVALRAFDASKHRWLLYHGTQAGGLAEGLPQIGSFSARGSGQFFAPATVGGKILVVRYCWQLHDGNPHFERALSIDHGKTWDTDLVADYAHSRS